MTSADMLTLINTVGVPTAFLVLIALGVFVSGKTHERVLKRVELLESQQRDLLVLTHRMMTWLERQERDGRQP